MPHPCMQDIYHCVTPQVPERFVLYFQFIFSIYITPWKIWEQLYPYFIEYEVELTFKSSDKIRCILGGMNMETNYCKLPKIHT